MLVILPVLKAISERGADTMNKRNEKMSDQSNMLLEELRKMEQTDIKKVSREDLVDIADVEIDFSLPVERRVSDYLEQIKNPYCYISNGVIVKISFAGKYRLEDCLAKCMGME